MTSRAPLLIVIPCLNEEAHLPGLLQWLATECPHDPIVVADGGSTDRSRDVVTAFAAGHANVHLIDNPRRIQSAGINRAAALLGDGCEWLLRIDAHCLYPAGYARELLRAARERRATSVVVPMVSRGHGCFQRAAAAAQNSVLGTGGSPHRHLGHGRLVDHGHHALMRLDLFRAVGGYREDMPHNEDAELDLRLLAAGGRIWLEPGQALVYFPRGTPRGLWRQYFGYGTGRARTLLLHRTRPKMRQLAPLAVAGAAGLALLSPIHAAFAAPLALWALLSLVAGMAIGMRAGGGCAMLAGVAAMIMHSAWSLGFLRGVFAGSGRPPHQQAAIAQE